MSNPVIKVENLSKQYRLGEVGTGTISHDLNRWWHRIRGKEDPYLRVGESNDRSKKGTSEYVWALEDINFEVQQGEVLGIIGKNGAGKSTLLKILSKVTAPTTGSIKAKGRIASLLEVGTGFHPELTGRENIYLNGTILGMTKREVNAKLDEIVDFAGVERYLDTPVKRYSSGMMVRLGFAVAAHLEPEILIVDEVLAVGDVEFQKKAVGKIQDVTKKGGRTVLFVSHNMGVIKSLCQSGMLLKNGRMIFNGKIEDTIKEYVSVLEKTEKTGSVSPNMRKYNTGEAKIHSLYICDDYEQLREDIYYREDIRIKINIEVYQKIVNALLDVKVITSDETVAAHNMNTFSGIPPHTLMVGAYQVEVVLQNALAPGNYSITAGIHLTNGNTIEYVENVYPFQVLKAAQDDSMSYPYNWVHGYQHPQGSWQVKQVEHAK